MHRYLTVILIVGLVVLTGCSTGFVPRQSGGTMPPPSGDAASLMPASGLMQSSDAGAVTVDVEWAGERGDRLVFNVVMNTHSVDLDGYDLAELATLKDAAGTEYKPVSWEAAPGGHHRQGVLVFPLPASVSQRTSGELRMIIRGIAGIDERVLVWEL